MANTKEAGYLSAYFPVPAIPALLILYNGRVLLCLEAGLEKAQFRLFILQTLEKLLSPSETNDHLASQPTADSVSSSESTLAEPDESPPSAAEGYVYPRPTSIPRAATPAPGSSASVPTASSAIPAMLSASSSRIQQMLAERKQRLEKDQKDKEAAESRVGNASGGVDGIDTNSVKDDREKADGEIGSESRRQEIIVEPDPAKVKQAQYAQQQRNRKKEAKLERERILRDIENNKAERKAKEERRKALARIEAEANDDAGKLASQQLARKASQPQQKSSEDCAIQVRLFDGGTVRHRFPANQSLRSHVRLWIEEQKLDGGMPFTFKHILVQSPNRSFSMTEEHQSLQSLGLTPSATLIITPVQGYATAYAGGQNILSRGLFAAYSLIVSMIGLVTGALGTFFGTGGTVTAGSEEELPSAVEHGPPSQRGVVDARPRIKLRTLRDQGEDHTDHQLYNGNQLNFEPRKKADEEEE